MSIKLILTINILIIRLLISNIVTKLLTSALIYLR